MEYYIRYEWTNGLGPWRVWVRIGGCIRSWWRNRRERHHWVDLGVDGWIILRQISRRWDVGIWTGLELAQDRDRWRTFVSAVMNLRVPWSAGNFLASCKPVSFSRRTLHHGVSKYEWTDFVWRTGNVPILTHFSHVLHPVSSFTDRPNTPI